MIYTKNIKRKRIVKQGRGGIMNKKRLAEQIVNDLLEHGVFEDESCIDTKELSKQKDEIIELIESRLRGYVMIDGNIMH